MPRKNEQSIKDALSSMVRKYHLKPMLDESKVIRSWEKLVGAHIASHTEKVFLRNNKLYLKIDSAPLRQELQYQKQQFLKVLEKELGEKMIVDIVFY